MDESIEAALLDFFLYQMSNVYTAMPCKVIRVEDAERGILAVQPMLKVKGFVEGEDTDRPVILGVPLMTLGTRKSLVRIPVEDGDFVLCIFSQRGLDKFKSGDGSIQAPTDFRLFDKRDAVAIPGLFPFDLHPNLSRGLDSAATDLSLTHNIGTAQEVTMRLTAEGEFKVEAPASAFHIECATAEINAEQEANIIAPIINLDGVLNINGTPYLAHFHPAKPATAPGEVSGPVVIP